jgi:hypothetical protein
MLVVFRNIAEVEVAEVVDWYEKHAPQLVGRFEEELDDIVRRIERTLD